jgi:superfamily I DNA/RNA helicase
MLDSLNDEQREAVVNIHDNLLVNSIPGSGKTRVLETKTAHIIDQDSAAKIIAVTFTRDSAMELQERIARQVGNEIKRVHCSTFHAIALNQLKRHDIRPKIISDGQRYQFIRRALNTIDSELSFDEAVRTIDYFKSDITIKIPDNARGDLYRAYNELLTRNHSIDFADMMLQATRGMHEGTIKPIACTHLLVDEFQDADPVQLSWIDAHVKNGAIATLVGDDDQAIYAFRHSLGYKGMTDFEKRHPTKRVIMNINYRCHHEILYRAECLIVHNAHERIEKSLFAHKGTGGHVELKPYPARDDESMAIMKAVEKNPNTWAVLGRTNLNLDDIEGTLTSFKVPYVRLSGKSLWEKPAVVVLTGLLTALGKMENVGIDQALSFCGATEDAISALHDRTKNKLIKGMQADTKIGTKIDAYASGKVINSLAGNLDSWYAQLKRGDRVEMVLHGVTNFLKRYAPHERDQELLEIAVNALCRLKGTLGERIEFVTRKKKKDDAEGVRLLTLHGSKGLEFDNVWMLACEENTLPHKDRESIEEERRLTYVGMTRARNHLTLSYTGGKAIPSRFLVEAGLLKPKAKDGVEAA